MVYKLPVTSQFTEERKHFQGIQNELFEHKAVRTFQHTSKVQLSILIGKDETITGKLKN